MPFPTLYSCTSVIIIIAYVYLKHVINAGMRIRIRLRIRPEIEMKKKVFLYFR